MRHTGACGEPEPYLSVHDVGQVERLLHNGHEGLPQVCGHKHVGHGQQAVGAEGLDQEQAVDGLPDGCCRRQVEGWGARAAQTPRRPRWTSPATSSGLGTLSVQDAAQVTRDTVLPPLVSPLSGALPPPPVLSEPSGHTCDSVCCVGPSVATVAVTGLKDSTDTHVLLSTCECRHYLGTLPVTTSPTPAGWQCWSSSPPRRSQHRAAGDYSRTSPPLP